MKIFKEKHQSQISVSHTDYRQAVKGWTDSVISKKRMFVGALDSRIEERKVSVRLETTERDIEESISINKKHVKRLLKKISKMAHFLDSQEDPEDAKEAMKDIEAQLQEAEMEWRRMLKEFLTLKKTVGKVIRNM